MRPVTIDGERRHNLLMTRHASRDLLAALAVVAIVGAAFNGCGRGDEAGPAWEPKQETGGPQSELLLRSASDEPPEPFVSTVPPLTYDLTVEPRTIPQLRRSIDRAYSAYEGQLRLLMRERGLDLHGIAAAHEIIGQPAEDAIAAFRVEQERLQDAFGAQFDARSR